MSRLDKAAKIGVRLIVDAYGPDRSLNSLENVIHNLLWDKSGDVVFQRPIPLIRDLDEKGYWDNAFSVFGNDGKTIAQKISDDPTGESLKAVLDENWKRILDQYDKIPTDLREKTVLQYKTSGSTDGHRGVFAGQVSVPHADKLFESDAILRHMLYSFPPDALVFEPTWMEKAHEAAHMVDFIKAYKAEAGPDTKQYFAEGGSLAKCGALLGRVNAVVVLGVIFQEVNGRKVITMVVATLKDHALDGINLWGAALDPRHPDIVTFCNKLLGKHKISIMDWANNFFGQILMITTWKTVPFSVEAEAAGVPLDEYIFDLLIKKESHRRANEIFINRWVLAGLDRTAFLPKGIRKLLGSNLDLSTIVLDASKDRIKIEKLLNFTADTTIAEFEALKLKTETNLAEGFYVNRSPIDHPYAFMAFNSVVVLPSALESAALNAARNPAQQLLDTTTISNLRTAINEQINASILPSLLAREPAGIAKTISKLRQTLPWTNLAENYLLTNVTPDLEAQVRETIKSDANFSDIPDLLIEKAVVSAVRETLCLPLLAPQAYVEQITALKIYETIKVAVPTPEVTVPDRVNALTQAAAAMDVEVRNMKQQLDEVKGREEYKEKKKEVDNMEQEVKQLRDKAKDLNEVGEDLKGGEGKINEITAEVQRVEKDPRRLLEHGR
ncbi:hypothetical protein B0T20DRAFT_482282 [Sordaria brevicollis]|uniref:Uncharacterized protein n=1 Tax=Sordaria brevicollis TaxID=83679 RepID=A0AAE0P9P7_SORBR|nr:hypothetical protein B0T20DRAFT_482282 [Sordaria brevicollis]